VTHPPLYQNPHRAARFDPPGVALVTHWYLTMVADGSRRPNCASRPPQATPPPDFTSGQPGGRGALEAPSPETEESVFDAEIAETREPAPMRVCHSNGDDDEEVPPR
jgi:hypothetical protein